MNFDFPPFAIAYVFTAGVSIVVAYLAWRRRSTPGGLSIALLMLGVTEWALTAALEIGSVGESAKLFWSKIEYLGTVSSSVLFLIFALQYTRQEKWLTRRNVVLLWVIPLITLVMAATNEMHHWVWSRTEPSPVGNNLLIYYHGPWFWIYAAYAYACVVIGTLALIWAIVRFPNAYRQQAGAMLAGALVPWLGNVIYVFGLNPIPGFDATPITFALTGLFISWGIFRYRLFDLVPVARDVLIESLSDGVLVLDAQNRIADINPAAQRLIGVSTAVIGQRAETALAGLPELARFCCESQEALVEISTGQEMLRYLELRTSFLRGRRGQITGRLIVLHDITERKNTENRLRRLSRAVEQSPASIVITDTAGRIEYVNPRFVEVTGYSFEEVHGRNPRILKSGETPPEEYQRLWSTITSGGEWRGEFHNKRKNGDLYWEFASISPITNEAGVITHFVAVKEDVTERKRVEAALQESESFYHSLVEVLPQSLCRKDLEGRFTFGNRWFCEGLKMPLEQIVGKTDLDLHPAELAEKYRRDDRWVMETGQILETVEEHIVVEGDKTYVQVVKSPIRDAEGRITGVQIIFWDITESKRAEEALRQSEQQIRSIIEQSQDGIALTDEQGLVIKWNRAMERITGLKTNEVVGKPIWDVQFQLGPEGRRTPVAYQQIKAMVLESLNSGQSPWLGQLVDSEYWHPDGTRRSMQGMVFPIKTDKGFMLGTISRDITERKQAEEALRSSEERFRQLAENVLDVFWITTPDWSQILYVSPTYEELWGCTCQSLYEQPMSFLDVVYPQDRPRILEALEKLKSGEPAFGEYRLVRMDGSVGWMRSRIFPIRNESGEVYRAAGITEDVTELKRAEEEMRHALAKEKELGELKSGFVSMASHEFRTPLSSILGSAELLERYGHKWAEEKKLQHLHKIQASVKNMVQLLEDVLIIGKAEAGKIEFRPAPLDLEQFCRGLVEEMQLQAGANHTLTFTSRGQCVDASMDEKLLRHILANLLSNAIKYSPQGGAVQLELDCQAGQAFFRVQDQGIGIPLEAQGRLFDTFHRAENVGNIPGTGLGMSIVKKSADLHGGTISFTSPVGAGTTFTVVIPLHSTVEEEGK